MHLYMYVYTRTTHLPVVSLNVEPAYCRMMPLDNLHARHEPGDTDVVRHGFGHEVLPRYVHVSRGQREIAEETTAILQQERPTSDM